MKSSKSLAQNLTITYTEVHKLKLNTLCHRVQTSILKGEYGITWTEGEYESLNPKKNSV